jgi:hypothetical protein
MELNKENYHSLEANQYYMSNSQYKDFIECEAMAMAKIKGELIQPQNDACLLGSYVHAWAEGELDSFKESNPALFKKNGELYANFEVGNRMIQTLRDDPFVMFVLQGEKEVIITAELFGVMWKIRLDVRNKKRLVDIKTMKAIRDKHWNKAGGYWETTIEAYGYLRQLAIYCEIERIDSGSEEWLEPLIVAVSKEDEPDKEIISLDSERMQMELDEVEKNMPRIIEVKNGLSEPKRCEQCKYCRRTKKLTKITHYMDLLP